MLNVQNLTNTLSRMELPDLQKYAAMHKNDPYVVSLALSIANQKKQMMVGKAGQAGMQPQPKVVDQQIAQMAAPPPQQMAAAPQQQMLPEDTGIGQLPAQNMQNMAEGGIVAFEDGGEVPRMFNGGVPPRPVQRIPGDPIALEWDRKYGATHAPDGMLKASKQQYILDPASKKYIINPKYVASPAASVKPAVSAVPVSAPPPKAPPPPPPPPPPPLAAKPAAPAAPVPAAAPVDLMTGIKTLNTKPMTAEEAMAASETFGTGSEITDSFNQLRLDTIKSNEDLLKAYEKGIAGLAKPGEQAEARLEQREAEDVVSKADAKAMSIFKAGLGMMAGTSQNAFENIGKGAMAGLEEYSASIKDFRKLAIERDKAYAEIEAARNAASRDDFKTSVGLQEKAADRLSRVNEKGIDITATLFKTNKDAAASIWNAGNTQASANARSENETRMQANKSVFEQNTQTQRQRESRCCRT
jgi:hypothetical protein